MPHIVVEYSSNLEPELAPQQLIDAVHEAALATGVFPLGGLRTRAERRDVYAVADRDPGHAFIAVLARIGAGRDAATRRRVAEALLSVLDTATQAIARSRGLAMSVDVEEIDPTASLKKNNLHERLEREAAAS